MMAHYIGEQTENYTDTGQPVFLPFRMSCFVISNLIVTAGMLTPNLRTRGTILWQITNQSLNVAINSANANQSMPLTTSQLIKSYLLAVSASCSVAVGMNALVSRFKQQLKPTTYLILSRLVPFTAVATAGALNVFLMRSEEIRQGIDIYPVPPPPNHQDTSSTTTEPHPQLSPKPLGKSHLAALHAVSETAISRVLNATPIMVIPPLILLKLQQHSSWLRTRPLFIVPVNLGLILTTSIFALPLALAVFPQRQRMEVRRLEREFWGEEDGEGDGGVREVEFNRGI
jgi:sideroflexin-5